MLGLVVGLAAALAAARLTETVLFGVTAHDPATHIGSGAALILVAVIAAALPARSATRGSVIAALRDG